MESIRAVDRAIDILNAFTLDQPALTIEQIMKQTGLARATAYRLLYTMERRGLIRYDKDKLQYRLGLRFLQYSDIVTTSLDVVQEAGEILDNLHLKTGHTILMTLVEDTHMLYVFKREIPTGLKYSSSVGERRPLTYGAVGRAALAFQPPEVVERLLAEPVPAYTPYTVTDPAAIREELKQVRSTHLYTEVDQTNLGVTAIGSPVFRSDGTAIGAIGMVCPSVQITKEQLEEAKVMLMDAAKLISSRMGYSMERK
jgi:DNA-binding IclR family transcriptional regulator